MRCASTAAMSTNRIYFAELGELVWDGADAYRAGGLTLGPWTFELALIVDPDDGVESVDVNQRIAGAQDAVRRIRGALGEIEHAILRELFGLYSSGWRENRPELSAAAFISCLNGCELAVYVDGQFTLSFDDGDLFLGHSIDVSFEEGAWEVALQG
jgi:hypothetical protein